MQPLISLATARMFEQPFAHFFVATAMESASASTLLSWLESDAPWKLKIADFYEQYEFSLHEADLPAELQRLHQYDELGLLCQEMGRLFNVHLSEDHIDITAHKLVSDQRIRIHNDYIPGQETHRLLIQFNRGWNEDRGGLLLLFSGPSADSLSRVIQPLHQSAVGFAISPRSQHAVAPVRGGERFTLVYSFYAR
jgi:Rps23 Pro-64 3,4-dihydroxylase Tpa1-like proline 4-hydroxylase